MDEEPRERKQTGAPVLDEVLDGGIPAEQSVLVTGGPGTGKTTFALQFLQQGLAEDDTGLFVTTEQSIEDLRRAFRGFDFALESDDLTVVSLHPAYGQSLDAEAEELVIKTLDGEKVLVDNLDVPLKVKYIKQYLEEYGPADRVALDSASALRPIAADREMYRQGIIELIHLFSKEFEATSVFTTEDYRGDIDRRPFQKEDSLQFTMAGVLRLWRENVNGYLRRFLRVEKMRGCPIDDRKFVVRFGSDGLEVVPRERRIPSEAVGEETLTTGIPELDAIAGGYALDGLNLLERDATASLDMLYLRSVCGALDEGYDVVFAPNSNVSLERFRQLLSRSDYELDALLDADRLKYVNTQLYGDSSHRNLIEFIDIERTLEDQLDAHKAERDNPLLSLFAVEPFMDKLAADELIGLLHRLKSKYGDDDAVVFSMNPDTLTAQEAHHYRDTAQQVFRTWTDESGLQHLQIKKSPTGDAGVNRVVEYTHEPPYIRLK